MVWCAVKASSVDEGRGKVLSSVELLSIKFGLRTCSPLQVAVTGLSAVISDDLFS
jgi:hypothetical protein